jgi:hypothetical protein
MHLWTNQDEIDFFKKSLDGFSSVEDLFYRLNSKYYAYIPKGIKGKGATIQSRNSLIGKFTEKWAKDLFEPIAKDFGLYALNGVVCYSLGLNKQSSADLAFCTTNEHIQKAKNIRLLFEIKMSIVSNYEYISNKEIKYIGNYKTHKGNPSLLRSDSMLKAIGKSINRVVQKLQFLSNQRFANRRLKNDKKRRFCQKFAFFGRLVKESAWFFHKSNIRVSDIKSTKIPVVVLDNSPITNSYSHKVYFLKTAGVEENAV